MTDNLKLTKTGRQYVLSAVVRFDGADVPAGAVINTGVELEMPEDAIILRCKLVVITVETGASATFNVGTVADDDGYGAALVATAVAGVDGSGALLGEYVAAGTRIYVSQGTGAFVGDGDFVLVLEYVAVGRSNEAFG